MFRSKQLARIELLLVGVLKNQEMMMSKLDDLTAALQAETTAVSALVTTLQADVASLQKQLADALANNQAPTQAQLDALQGVSDKLAAIASASATPAPTSAPATPIT